MPVVLRGDSDVVQAAAEERVQSLLVEQIAVALDLHSRFGMTSPELAEEVDQKWKLSERLTAREIDTPNAGRKVVDHGRCLGASDRGRPRTRPVIAMRAGEIAVVREDPVEGLEFGQWFAAHFSSLGVV